MRILVVNAGSSSLKLSLLGEWFFSGDRYRRDADGFYWYEGRSDDMIKVSGLWVSPVEVEGVLLEHPAVGESAVVVVSGTGLTHEPSRSATLFAAEAARAAGREVFLDLDYRPDQWGSRAAFAQTVQHLSARSSTLTATVPNIQGG